MFDRNRCKRIVDAVRAALKPLEKDLEVGFTVRGSFRPTEFTMRVQALEFDARTGEAPDPYVADFKEFAREYGMKPEMLGAEFVAGSRSLLLHGLKRKARRAPIIGKDTQTGKLYRFEAFDVLRFLKAKNEQTVPVGRSAVAA